MAELSFWVCLLAVVYPYAVYPALLAGWNRLAGRRLPEPDRHMQPSVTVILPIHNEARRIAAKVQNLLELAYPGDLLQLVVVGDGCTDASLEIAARTGAGRVTVKALPERIGKAGALNAGLESATGEIVVYTDAGILLEPDALQALAGHFANPEIGCVSGEDYIEGGSSEGLYGRLELWLRREEAKLHSIAGASGCIYAQRRSLCRPFVAGMAPDFFSVLTCVEAGYRAVSEPAARGVMNAAPSAGAEFERKTRTFLRGMTTLSGNATLLNPIRFPSFSFVLASHKLMRWLAPVALVGCLASSWLLRSDGIYEVVLYLQVGLYALAAAGLMLPAVAARSRAIRLCAFFLLVNLAVARAFAMWIAGVRQEVWEPTRRPT